MFKRQTKIELGDKKIKKSEGEQIYRNADVVCDQENPSSISNFKLYLDLQLSFQRKEKINIFREISEGEKQKK